MPRFVLTSFVLLIASAAPAQEKKLTPDDVLKDLLRNRKEMAELMKATRTRADAEKTAARLTLYAESILACEKSMEQMEARLSVDEQKAFNEALARKYASQYKSTNAEFMKALIRLEIEYPEAYRVLKDNALLRQHREMSLKIVQQMIAAHDRNVRLYVESAGSPPKSLRLAVESVYSTLLKESLLDPWGRPYQYDRDGKNNGGAKPDIWIVDPFDGKTLIGNWKAIR